MFENVIVGVDGKPGGRDAIALAGRLAGEGATVALVHVRGGAHPLHPMAAGLPTEEASDARELLERERDAAGVDYELLDLVGQTPGSALHRLAEKRDADLTVVGSSSRGPLGRAALGDHARAALNGAPCAIAIAARGYAEQPLQFARIGVAYDASPESEAALSTAREIAGATRAEVRLLQVVTLPSYAFTGLTPAVLGETMVEVVEEAQKRLQEMPGVTPRAVYGLAGEELAAFSGEVDLLVAGSRSYGPLRRLVVGSTSDYLERHARSSLLILPRAALAPAAAPAAATASGEEPIGGDTGD
jgi:nucleotide-binding universal stress UspA family protein